ncbi:MAG: hypothetical protein ACRD07_13410 [Acidimicrobiales bacterium]
MLRALPELAGLDATCGGVADLGVGPGPIRRPRHDLGRRDGHDPVAMVTSKLRVRMSACCI